MNFLIVHLLRNTKNPKEESRTQSVTLYNTAYQGIARSNYVLDNIDRVTTTNTSLINRLKSEARVLRAYQYIKLAGFFGDVILSTKTVTIEEGRQMKRTPVSEVWDFIDKELLESSAFLPVTYALADKGRVTKGAIYLRSTNFLEVEFCLYTI